MPHPLTNRIDWVDYAKGFCIILVVMMHSTLGVEAALGEEGWTHIFVAFARPFRMPDFFLISGLFLARVIDRDWRVYTDRKVLHFAYFYVLWLIIQCLFKCTVYAENPYEVLQHFAYAFIQPFGTMWFIYLLPLFFVFTKLTRRIPAPVILLLAAALEMPPIETGWVVIDEFAARYVYFYLGYLASRHIFAIAHWAQAHSTLALAGLAGWALINGGAVLAGWSTLPGISLALGLIGAVAVVTISALLAKLRLMSFLRYAGQNSIVIYLAFFLPMAATRTFFIKTQILSDIGAITLIVTAMGVIFPLLLHGFVKRYQIGLFLFERPGWARLKPASATEQKRRFRLSGLSRLRGQYHYLIIFAISCWLVIIRSIDLLQELLARDFHISQGGLNIYGRSAAIIQFFVILGLIAITIAVLRKIYLVYTSSKS